jgi:hypothetical protein
MKLEMNSLMRRNLKNDKGKSEFEYTLQRHHTPERIVKALHRERKKVQDQQHVHDAAEPLKYASEYREPDSAIQTDGTRHAPNHVRRRRKLNRVRL